MLCALIAVAFAQDPTEDPGPPSDPVADARARELFQNGSALYEEGQYEAAIVAWEEAYALSPRPLLLFNIANALERLGRWQDAMKVLTRYRAYAEDEERETLDRRIKAILARIEEQDASRKSASPSTPAPAAPAPKAERGFPVASVVLFGAGGAGLVTGAGFGFGALAARDQAAAGCVEQGGATWCSDVAADALRQDRTRSLVADLALGLGAACAIGGVVTLVVPLDVAVGPGTVTLAGRF
jgi:tetratricopeptide (TPR) repeat protein